MTKIHISFFALALLSVLWIGACSKNDSNPVTPNSSGGVFPLAVGNKWLLQKYTYDNASGGMKASSVDTMKIVQDTLIRNEKWFTTGNGSYMTNRTGGTWLYDANTSMQLYLKYPAQVDDSYRVIQGDSVNSYDTMLVKMLSINQSVTVPAGTFSCMTYQITYASSKTIRTLQFAPGKGLVFKQTEGENPVNGEVIVLTKSELMSYSVQ